MRVIVEKSTGHLIGHVGLIKQNVDDAKEIEIGYWLAPDDLGKGYSKDTENAFRNDGLDRLKLPKLISPINPNHRKNDHGKMEKSQMKKEACITPPEGRPVAPNDGERLLPSRVL